MMRQPIIHYSLKNHRFLYNLIITLYLVGVAIYSRFNEKVRKMWRGECEAISILREMVVPGAKYVWVHAASLGEFEQGRPIIERLRREHPELKILLTFFSPSGYEVRKDYEGADIVCYLPIDTPRNARRFLDAVNPVCALFVKYEFWYNYLHILHRRGIPTYSVSSIFRPGQIFFRWYGKQYSRVLNCFTHFFVQNDESLRLLHTIGIDNVTITGDTRFDRVLAIAQEAKSLPLVEEFVKGKKVFIAGSSWLPDEKIFIPFFKDHPDWTLVIAPHVIAEEHLRQIEALLEHNGRKAIRLSKATLPPKGEHWNTAETSGNPTPPLGEVGRGSWPALLIDCFGLLSSIYRYADVTYVGGGFGVGIHNVLEAAVWHKPVVFGPNNSRFKEARELIACGGAMEITGAEDFHTIANRLLTDESYLAETSLHAGSYVSTHAGATDAILQNITNNTILYKYVGCLSPNKK